MKHLNCVFVESVESAEDESDEVSAFSTKVSLQRRVLPLVAVVVVFSSLALAALFFFKPKDGDSHWPKLQYAMVEMHSGNDFFANWSFFTDTDPTEGCVDYVSRSEAKLLGLISTTDTQSRMAVDSTYVYGESGRKSVRIESKKRYNGGLFVLDVEHIPIGCGTWPAFWSYGPKWPRFGEIDVIEGVNLQRKNQMALHTSKGCDMGQAPERLLQFSGEWMTGTKWYGNRADDCNVKASGQQYNKGCAVDSNSRSSYGRRLNKRKGGVVAHQWTEAGIRIWWFKRGHIPDDIVAETPKPHTWGKPVAAFPFGHWCPSSFFQNHTLVFDTTLCGYWAGVVWNSECSHLADTCEDYVLKNPEGFEQAFWTINYLKLFQSFEKPRNGKSQTTPPH